MTTFAYNESDSWQTKLSFCISAPEGKWRIVRKCSEHLIDFTVAQLANFTVTQLVRFFLFSTFLHMLQCYHRALQINRFIQTITRMTRKCLSIGTRVLTMCQGSTRTQFIHYKMRLLQGNSHWNKGLLKISSHNVTRVYNMNGSHTGKKSIKNVACHNGCCSPFIFLGLSVIIL